MAQKGVSTKSDYMPMGDMNNLIIHLREDKDYFSEMYFIIAVSTALRYSDLSELRWSDLIYKNKSKSSILIKEKKRKKQRKVTLSNTTQERITFFYSIFKTRNTTRRVFCKLGASKPITIQAMNKKLKSIAMKYGVNVESFSTHSFRKTFGRYLWEQGNKSDYSLMLLCDIFAHSNISTTKIYLGLRDEEIADAYKSIGDALS